VPGTDADPLYRQAGIAARRACAHLAHDVSRFDELVAPGYVNHNPFAEPGSEGVKTIFGAIIAGVPDLKANW
jgi:hypothetical protein